MNEPLPLIPSHTCSHHSSTPFPPTSEVGEEDTPEQSKFFKDVALWIFQQDERIHNPIAELQNPKYGILLDEIRNLHRGVSRFMRLGDNNLRLGVSMGCPFCKWMTGWLPKTWIDKQSCTDYFVRLRCREDHVGFAIIRLSDGWSYPSDTGNLLIEGSYLAFHSWTYSDQRHILIHSASLENVLSRTRTWLRTCIDDDSSRAKHTGSFSPTRVLELRSHEGIRRVRLIETKEPLPSYATLSYCWGVSIQPGWLTRSVIQQYKQGIDVAALPPSLQDAITVTEILGIHYLWIDALCIIQDDKRDKNIEIDQMGKIYENSTITILASRTSSVTTGFLRGNFETDNKDIPWILKVSGDIDIDSSTNHTTKSRNIVLLPKDSMFEQAQEPLSLRGWTFQERLLSHRTLTFGLSEIAWGYGNDTGTSSFRERYLYDRLPYQAPPKDNPEFWPNCWAALVKEFTQRELRYPKDRLPALAGIAQRWGDGLDDSYVAGLWRSSLPGALLWRVPEPEPALAPNELLLAPSWSWAAVKGPVGLHVKPHNYAGLHAECLEVQITHESPDSMFGAVASGIVKLYGILTPVRLDSTSEHPNHAISVVGDEDAGVPSMRVSLDRELASDGRTLFVLPISSGPGIFRMQGLILAEDSGGTFARVGAVSFPQGWKRLLVGAKRVVVLV